MAERSQCFAEAQSKVAAGYKQRVDNEAESIYKAFKMNEQEASVSQSCSSATGQSYI
jgi:hypothetical protein